LKINRKDFGIDTEVRLDGGGVVISRSGRRCGPGRVEPW
jgi:polyisoprenoid-binding protein YceI